MGLREFFGLQPKQHSVEVHDVRPLADEESPFAPYFAAICDCGWVDAPLESEAEARASATAHSAKVAPDLKRPIG